MSNHSKYPKEAGIYKLTCIDNDKIYIGKAVNLYNRLNRHKNCQNKSEGRCYFENAIIKHGWNSFLVEILEIVENFDKLTDNSSLLERESYYIKLFGSTDKTIGYNLCEYSFDRTGIHHTEESKRKMSISRTGKIASDETKIKMSKSQFGRTHSSETKDKMKKPKSEEFKEKCRKRIMSEETKDKIRQSRIGKSFSEEHKQKLRESKLGKPRKRKHV